MICYTEIETQNTESTNSNKLSFTEKQFSMDFELLDRLSKKYLIQNPKIWNWKKKPEWFWFRGTEGQKPQDSAP